MTPSRTEGSELSPGGLPAALSAAAAGPVPGKPRLFKFSPPSPNHFESSPLLRFSPAGALPTYYCARAAGAVATVSDQKVAAIRVGRAVLKLCHACQCDCAARVWQWRSRNSFETRNLKTLQVTGPVVILRPASVMDSAGLQVNLPPCQVEGPLPSLRISSAGGRDSEPGPAPASTT